MESQDHEVRVAMREMRKLKKPFARARVCTTCVGWEDFGGVRVEDVSMGPICVCDKTWLRVQLYLRDMPRNVKHYK